MAKAKFERTKPHVNVGTIGHVDHGKTTLTAALTKVSADKGYGTKYIAYDEVAKASASQGRRDPTKILTIATSHVEYEIGEPPLRARGLPGTRGLREEHDHGCRADGRRDPGRERGRRPMPQTREHILLARQVERAAHRGVPQQVRSRRRPRAPRPGRARSARAALEVQLPRRQRAGDSRRRDPGDRRRREVGRRRSRNCSTRSTRTSRSRCAKSTSRS